MWQSHPIVRILANDYFLIRIGAQNVRVCSVNVIGDFPVDVEIVVHPNDFSFFENLRDFYTSKRKQIKDEFPREISPFVREEDKEREAKLNKALQDMENTKPSLELRYGEFTHNLQHLTVHSLDPLTNTIKLSSQS